MAASPYQFCGVLEFSAPEDQVSTDYFEPTGEIHHQTKRRCHHLRGGSTICVVFTRKADEDVTVGGKAYRGYQFLKFLSMPTNLLAAATFLTPKLPGVFAVLADAELALGGGGARGAPKHPTPAGWLFRSVQATR